MSGILIAWRIKQHMTAVVEISVVADLPHHWQVFDDQEGCCPMSRGRLIGEGRASSIADAMGAALEAAYLSLKVHSALKNDEAEAVSPPEGFNPSDCADCQYHHKYFADAFEKSGHCYLFIDAPTNRCSQKVSINADVRPPVFDPMWVGKEGF